MTSFNKAEQSKKTENQWWVYLVSCSDKSLYCGVTTDTERRVNEHNSDNKKGAKYTRTRRPVTLVFKQPCASRVEACQNEYKIKQLSRLKKLELIKQFKQA